MKSVLLGTALLAGSLCAHAQSSLVADINQEASGSGNSNPCWLSIFRNRVVFFANDGINGQEIWAIDTNKASRQYDLNPGNLDGVPTTDNRKLAMIDTFAYFPGDDGTSGTELMRWDGKTKPQLELDIRTGGFSSDLEYVVAHNGMLYFAANDGIMGNELWSYNPKTKYKQRLTSLAIMGSFPRYLTMYKNKLYFVANSDTWGDEVFVYDPATNSTTVLKDLWPGTTGVNPLGLTVINEVLYFRATDMMTSTPQMWSYNGKDVVKITSLQDGVQDPLSTPNPFAAYNGKIYFAGDNSLTGRQLFSYDPSKGVVALVFILNPSGHSDPANFIEFGGKLYFSAIDALNGRELWSYDGVNAPKMAADVAPGPSSSNPANMLRVNTELYFSAYNPAVGVELFKMKDSAALGVQNVRFNADVNVYPNPANTITNVAVTLKQAQTMSLVVTDAMGKLVYKLPAQRYENGTHTMQVPVAALANGVYLYRLCDAQGAILSTGRIQKQ